MRRLVVATALLGLTGCSWSGIDNGPLPFAKGNGDDALTVTVELANAVNLVPNSEVKVGDLTVGSVRRIRFEDWHAELEVGLEKDVRLPGNAVARVGQKSLLGAEYLELAAPGSAPAAGRLDDGDTIPLARSGRYPETEELFAALSAVLNGGGLNQVGTITAELDKALHGRESDVRDLVRQLGRFIGDLDAQRGDIVSAIESLDRLSGTFADQRETLARALHALPRGVRALRDQRAQLTEVLDHTAAFGSRATAVLDASGQDIVSNVRDLRPVLEQLSEAGDSLTNVLADATFPFPLLGLLKSAKGDYLNLFLTVDLTSKAIRRDFLDGFSPLDPAFGGLLGQAPDGTVTDGGDPLRLPPGITRPTPKPERPGPGTLPDGLGLGGAF